MVISNWRKKKKPMKIINWQKTKNDQIQLTKVPKHLNQIRKINKKKSFPMKKIFKKMIKMRKKSMKNFKKMIKMRKKSMKNFKKMIKMRKMMNANKMKMKMERIITKNNCQKTMISTSTCSVNNTPLNTIVIIVKKRNNCTVPNVSLKIILNQKTWSKLDLWKKVTLTFYKIFKIF